MPSVFETSPAAIPISFVTKSSWDQVAETLPAPQRAFATACAFAAKPGAYLALRWGSAPGRGLPGVDHAGPGAGGG